MFPLGLILLAEDLPIVRCGVTRRPRLAGKPLAALVRQTQRRLTSPLI
jgi:hypothetical protein